MSDTRGYVTVVKGHSALQGLGARCMHARGDMVPGAPQSGSTQRTQAETV